MNAEEVVDENVRERGGWCMDGTGDKGRDEPRGVEGWTKMDTLACRSRSRCSTIRSASARDDEGRRMGAKAGDEIVSTGGFADRRRFLGGGASWRTWKPFGRGARDERTGGPGREEEGQVDVASVGVDEVGRWNVTAVGGGVMTGLRGTIPGERGRWITESNGVDRN